MAEGVPDQRSAPDAHLLRTYAQWSVLPRTRRRAARLGTSINTPKYARTRIETAAHFLTWLHQKNRTLTEATQHDVDTWIASGASTRRRIRDFLTWTHARGLSAALQVRWLGREGLAEHVLVDDQRWTLPRRCLRDNNLALHLRVAGALVLLYGQLPTRIAELTIDDVTTTDTDTFVVLQEQPILLPPSLGALTADLVARSAGEQSNTQPGQPRWLFPGARPGTHAYPGRLATALNQKAGIFVRPGHGSALSALAAIYRPRSSPKPSAYRSPRPRDGAPWLPATTPTTSPPASPTRRRDRIALQAAACRTPRLP